MLQFFGVLSFAHRASLAIGQFDAEAVRFISGQPYVLVIMVTSTGLTKFWYRPDSFLLQQHVCYTVCLATSRQCAHILQRMCLS